MKAAPRTLPGTRDWRTVYFLVALILMGILLASAELAPSSSLPSRALVPVLGVTVLDHPARMRIVAHLRILPGDHLRSISRTLQLSLGETRHHLSVLLRRGLLRENRSNGRCRYYVKGDVGSGRNEAFEKFWMYRDLRLRVLNAVANARTATPSEVAAVLGISRQLADYHLLRLAEMGYVHRENGHYRR